MKLESSIIVGAPPAVVFRFFCFLDHLRFVSPSRRREWCPVRGLALRLGAEHEVRVEQGRHALTLRFRTIDLVPNARYVDEFLSWPLAGARHVQTFEPTQGGELTLVSDVNHWEPPWYARSVVARRGDEQQAFFDEKLAKAKRIIETVYRVRQEAAFEDGIFEDAIAAGFEPVISPDG